MTELEKPVFEHGSFQTFSFEDFSPDKVASLTNWVAVAVLVEPDKKWRFVHKDALSGKSGKRVFEVFKTTDPTEGTTHINSVSFEIHRQSNIKVGGLLGVAFFSVGTIKNLTGAVPVVRFFGGNEKRIEVRDSGLVIPKNLTHTKVTPLQK